MPLPPHHKRNQAFILLPHTTQPLHHTRNQASIFSRSFPPLLKKKKKSTCTTSNQSKNFFPRPSTLTSTPPHRKRYITLESSSSNSAGSADNSKQFPNRPFPIPSQHNTEQSHFQPCTCVCACSLPHQQQQHKGCTIQNPYTTCEQVKIWWLSKLVLQSQAIHCWLIQRRGRNYEKLSHQPNQE